MGMSGPWLLRHHWRSSCADAWPMVDFKSAYTPANLKNSIGNTTENNKTKKNTKHTNKIRRFSDHGQQIFQNVFNKQKTIT